MFDLWHINRACIYKICIYQIEIIAECVRYYPVDICKIFLDNTA